MIWFLIGRPRIRGMLRECKCEEEYERTSANVMDPCTPVYQTTSLSVNVMDPCTLVYQTTSISENVMAPCTLVY